MTTRQWKVHPRFNMRVTTTGGEIVARVETSALDADLISAAPDLLAALESLLNCFELNMDDMEQSTIDEIVKAQAAIKKAKGEV